MSENASVTITRQSGYQFLVDFGAAIPQMLADEPASLKIASLLYKPDAFKGKHAPDFTGFSIPDKFVVGYGLDYKELGRELKSIYQLIN